MEGSITGFFRKSGTSAGSFRCGVHAVQIERAPLEEYAAGAVRDGVTCFLCANSADGATHACIQGVRNVDREVKLTCDHFRTANKWRRTMRFYEKVAVTRHRREMHDGHRIR